MGSTGGFGGGRYYPAMWGFRGGVRRAMPQTLTPLGQTPPCVHRRPISGSSSSLPHLQFLLPCFLLPFFSPSWLGSLADGPWRKSTARMRELWEHVALLVPDRGPWLLIVSPLQPRWQEPYWQCFSLAHPGKLMSEARLVRELTTTSAWYWRVSL
jgi:hypothetical protein